jgi:O-succinylbenzoic acid--CoA ligase
MVDLPEIEFRFETFKISSKALRANVENLSEFEIKVITFATDWLSGKTHFEFQTSGSTGGPRKIIFTRDQIKASANLTRDFFRLKQGYKALLCLDPDFVAARMMIVRSLEIGMDLYFFPPRSNPLVNLNEQIDFAAFVPYQLEAILNSNSSDYRRQLFKQWTCSPNTIQLHAILRNVWDD